MERYWQAYIVIFTTGAGWALDMPSRRSIIYDLLGDSAVTNGIALDSVGMYTSRMLGPALAGGLITLVNVSGGFVVASVFYLVTVTMMWSLRLAKDTVIGLKPGATSRGDDTNAEERAGKPLTGVREIVINLGQGFRYVRGKTSY